MKNELVLENYGVQELRAVEKQEVDGGVVPIAYGLIVGSWAIMTGICGQLIDTYSKYDVKGKLTRKAKC